MEIRELLEKYEVQIVEDKGEEILCFCPFHNETKPSFSFNKLKEVYYCFGCGEGGNVKKFITKMGGEVPTFSLSDLEPQEQRDNVFYRKILDTVVNSLVSMRKELRSFGKVEDATLYILWLRFDDLFNEFHEAMCDIRDKNDRRDVMLFYRRLLDYINDLRIAIKTFSDNQKKGESL